MDFMDFMKWSKYPEAPLYKPLTPNQKEFRTRLYPSFRFLSWKSSTCHINGENHSFQFYSWLCSGGLDWEVCSSIIHLAPPDLLTGFIPKILKKWYESKQFQWERLFPREDSHQYSRDWTSQQMYPKPRSVHKPRSAWQRLKFTAGRLEQVLLWQRLRVESTVSRRSPTFCFSICSIFPGIRSPRPCPPSASIEPHMKQSEM